ncbi:MAG TPA: hypothetical protein VLH80_07485 [Nitrospiraceae bacterium]|nr:hypothetical protein [Nitrospiraceae bacterium]
MAQQKLLNIQAIALSASAANLLNCNITSLAGPVGFTATQPYLTILHIRAVNNDSSPHTLKLFKGATGASAVGTEFAFAGETIGANSHADWYGKTRFDAADFLTGLADVANKITLNIDAEIGFA